MRKLLAIALLALCLAFASAQPAAPVTGATPEAVAQAYVEALRSKGMTALPEYIHPDELQRFKDMLAPMFAQAEEPAKQNIARMMFGPKATAESIQALSRAEFMRGFMTLAETQMKAMNVTLGDSRILGAVKEGEIVHRVTRNSAGAGELRLTQLEVVSLKPYQGSWRVLLSGKLEGMAQALKAQAGKGG
ncbi:hypothetical protein ABU614_16335 [Lysobacter firmicutimachus]|uniref:DUF4440 domain-containing protein n=1 Tax=Lysobacter firmicutimachus TaxID=1792846 RepID=A0AAU8MP37_9GAMM